MFKRKGDSLNNRNETNVERSENSWGEQRTDIFRGGGSLSRDEMKDAGISTKGMKHDLHSHTVIEEMNGQQYIVYDRDEYGNVLLDTKRGDTPAPINTPSKGWDD